MSKPALALLACRCFRNELRRIILAFAIRTASVLGDRFFGSGVVSAPAVGIVSSCIGMIESCATGCTLIGPGDVGLRLGIMDNSHVPRWFDTRSKTGRLR